MSRFLKLSTGALLLVGVLMAPALAKDPTKDDAVVQVITIDGPKMEYKKAGEGKWMAGKVSMAGFIKDHFRTDKSTAATVELLIGGRIGIKKGSEIVLISDGQAGTVEGNRVNKIQLNSGGAYAKFSKQDKPLTIQTRGGVMGIKGTEFTVETQENGETSIVLLEGSVDYTENGGESSQMVPGEKLTQFEKDGQLYTLSGEPEKVDENVEGFKSGSIPISEFDSIKNRLESEFKAVIFGKLRAAGIPISDSGELSLSDPTIVTALQSPGYLGTLGPLRSLSTSQLGFSASFLTNGFDAYIPSIPNWSGWTPDLSINGISIPGVNIGVPGVPGIRF